MRRAVSILCLLALVPLVLLFARVRGELPRETGALVREKYASWSGVLRIWICEGWDAGATGWLNRAIASYERGHSGVYVQARQVEASALRALADSGINPPDMVLVSPGLLFSADNLLELGGLPKLRDGLAESGGGYLAPVAMGAYGWAYDRLLLESFPSTLEGTAVSCAPDAEYVHRSAALLALCSGVTEVEVVPPGLDLGLPAAADAIECRLPEDFAPSQSAYADFAAGRAAIMPATQADVRRLTALSEMGRGPDWTVEPAGRAMLADQLLLLGIVDWPRADIEERQALCRELLSHLLSEDVQRTLSSAGLFAVVETAALYAGRAGYEGLEKATYLPLLVPDAFDASWRESAAAVAEDFAAGRLSAREGLERLRALFPIE